MNYSVFEKLNELAIVFSTSFKQVAPDVRAIIMQSIPLCIIVLIVLIVEYSFFLKESKEKKTCLA